MQLAEKAPCISGAFIALHFLFSGGVLSILYRFSPGGVLQRGVATQNVRT